MVDRIVSRRGFTLLELLAATTLAAILAVVAGRILLDGVRDLRRLDRELSGVVGGSRTAVAETIRVDATMARGLSTDATGVTFAGYVGRGGTIGSVRYEIAPFAGRPTLWRTAEAVREPVWVGAAMVDVDVMRRVVIEAEDNGSASGRAEAERRRGGLPRVPDRFAVRVADGRGRWIVREVIGD